jgi:translation initiation factor IF-3
LCEPGERSGPNAEVNAISTIETRVNERIRAPRLRLVGVDGEQLGIFATPDAQRIADDQGLDLVEVAPNADPPVARVMDFSKWKYEEAIKAKKARKNQTTVQVKEIKFRPKIDTHDYETKKKHVVRFIESGAKVKITIMFRGREMVHAERGLAILERLAEDIRELAHIESQPKLEGRNMFMLVSPSKKEIKPARSGSAAKAEAAGDAEEVVAPAEETAGDAEEVVAPAEETAGDVEEVVAPAEETAGDVEEVVAPAEETAGEPKTAPEDVETPEAPADGAAETVDEAADEAETAE